MVSDELNTLLKEFEKDLTIAAQNLLVKYGVEKNSKLIKSMEYEYDDKQDMFVLIANDYFQYLSTGRKKGIKKVPIKDLISWIKEKNILVKKSINNTAFAIQTAIYKNGIKGKKYINPLLDVSVDMISEYTAEELSEIIVNDIADAIENV